MRIKGIIVDESLENGNKKMIGQCFHCGNKGLMDIVYKFTQDISEGDMAYFSWEVLLCNVCKKVTLVEKYDCFFEEEPSTTTIVYPENKYDCVGIPHRVRTAFESAIKIKNIDTTISVLALRRTLEMICLNQKAQGRTLDLKIKDLVNRNILPNGLEKPSGIIRMLGNNAAHSYKKEFNSYEVEELIDLLKHIINYLYIIPEKMKKIKTKNKF